MRGGRLRHRLAIERATRVGDSFGQAIPTWATVATVWGEIRVKSGTERDTAGQTEAIRETVVVVRSGTEIRADDRLVVDEGTRTLRVVHVGDPDGRGRRQELVCREVVA